LDSQKTISTRKATRANASKAPGGPEETTKKKRKANAAPVLTLQLKDSELLEDLMVLKRQKR
jgi:hypothetical protein